MGNTSSSFEIIPHNVPPQIVAECEARQQAETKQCTKDVATVGGIIGMFGGSGFRSRTAIAASSAAGATVFAGIGAIMCPPIGDNTRKNCLVEHGYAPNAQPAAPPAPSASTINQAEAFASRIAQCNPTANISPASNYFSQATIPTCTPQFNNHAAQIPQFTPRANISPAPNYFGKGPFG